MHPTETAPFIAAGTAQPFYARREFSLAVLPVKAEALVCGLGQFTFYVNGKQAGDHCLDPAWTDYRKRIPFVRFDILPLLQQGDNVLAAEVGNGWYLANQKFGYFFRFPPFMPPNPNGYRPFGAALVLSVLCEFTYADGRKECIQTDNSWAVAAHPVCQASCYGSEKIDHRKEIPGWNDVGKVSGTWNSARRFSGTRHLQKLADITEMPPVRVLRTLSGRFLHRLYNNLSIYDFGTNCAGILQVTVRGKRGRAILCYPAEKLDEHGNADQNAKGWGPVDIKLQLIPREYMTFETFTQTFSYVGARYAAITADPEDIREVKILVISSAGEDAGSFSADDPRYEAVLGIIRTSMESNLLSVHTDCPTIERFAWQEVNHLLAPSVMYLKQVRPHWEKFLADMRDAQHTGEEHFVDRSGNVITPGEGLVPSQAPCFDPNVLPVPGLGDFYNAPGWGSAILLAARWHYLFYGDPKVIRDNFAAGERYFAFLTSCLDDFGLLSHGLGDWGHPQRRYAVSNIDTALYYADAKTLAEFAGILGRQEEQYRYQQAAESIRSHYNLAFLRRDEKTGRYTYVQRGDDPATQAVLALPLFWDMVPGEARKDVEEALAAMVTRDGALLAGEVGLAYLIPVLSDMGRNDLVNAFLLREEHPGYMAFIKNGETSLGEYWEDNPRSHNHDMLGHIAAWYYYGMAGIRPEAPGFSRVLIRPWLPKELSHLSCTYHAAAGDITVELTRREGGILLLTEAAPGIALTIDRSFLDREESKEQDPTPEEAP